MCAGYEFAQQKQVLCNIDEVQSGLAAGGEVALSEEDGIRV